MSFKKLLLLAAGICFLLAVLPVVELDVALIPLGLLLWVVSDLVDGG